MKTKKSIKGVKKVSPVRLQINTFLDKGFSPEKTALEISKANKSGLSNAKAWVSMTVKDRWINSLSKGKKTIALLLDDEYTPEQVALQGYRKAFITMVVNDAIEKAIKWKKIKNRVIEPTTTKTDYNGKGKRAMRRQAKNSIIDTAELFGINKGIVLTLSSFECELEKALNKLFKGFSFLSYEQDKSVFEMLKNEIKTKGFKFMLKPVNAPIIEGINTAIRENFKFSHLFLDFCNGLEKNNEEITKALKHDIVELNGVVWITISTRTGAKGYNSNNELMKLVNKAGGDRYELLPIANGCGSYRDGNPMLSILLRRVK